MLARLIENWLTSSTEMEFQLPFRQLLIDEGEQILHVADHGQLELGKDIFTLTADADLHAYQLKTGPVTQAKWDEIQPQVTRLVEVPIEHPSVGSRKADRVFLVSNRRFSEPVIEEIHRRNKDWASRSHPQVDVVSGDELLSRLCGAQSEVMPFEPRDLREFLTFWTQNGRQMLDKSALARILAGLLRLADDPRSSADAKRRVTGTILMSAYALHSFAEARNHIAVAEGWILVAAYLLAVAGKWSLAVQHWRPSFSLAFDAALNALTALAAEVKEREDYYEQNPDFEGEGFYQLRTTVVAGHLAALHLTRALLNRRFDRCKALDEFLSTQKEHLRIWGEAAVPDFTCLTLYMHLAGERNDARDLIGSVLHALATANEPRQPVGLPNPYWNSEKAWRLMHGGVGLSPAEQSESFSGSSYTIRSIAMLAARLGFRALLEDLWRPITRVAHEEFLPAEPWMEFFWQCDQGELRQRRFTKTQSWAKLCEQASETVSGAPAQLQEVPWLIPLFICTYPHRFRWTNVATLLRRLDEAVSGGLDVITDSAD